MKNKLLYLLLSVSTLSYAQVGIGTTTPQAFFNVVAGKTVLFGSDTVGVQTSTNTILFTPKLIWYGSKSAFRAGGLTSGTVGSDAYSFWNYDQVGLGSFASGGDTKASKRFTTAMGHQTTASGDYATALGNMTISSGINATSMGYNTQATADYSTSLGYKTIASGQTATAMGFFSVASGSVSTAIGYQAIADGPYSTAMGYKVSTGNNVGSFIIGDFNGFNYQNTAVDQMMMRFSGGYTLYSSAPASQTDAIGVQLPRYGNAWTTISDSTRKENFRAANGASFLQKIASMRLGSWNYKGQNAKQYRHYGPMAQDFFAAFGHDELGIVGEDKSINQADFDGVNLIAIQALIKEVNQLKAELSAAKEREQTTQARLDKIEALLQDHDSQATLIRKP